MLPGIYNPTYEMCSCTLQDHSQPKKFEKTGIVFSLFTLLLFTFVAVRINIYKHQMKSSTHHLPNKLLADLTLTTGFSLLFAAASIVKYIVGSTHTIVDFKTMQFVYLLALPITCISMNILFFAKNANGRKIILRELRDSLIKCIE
jgi:hypothetical protein